MVAAVGVVAVQTTASAHDGRKGRHDSERHDSERHGWSPVTRQDFSLTSDIIEEGGGTVVASGAINATGEDVVISDTEDHFIFPDGTLTVFHAPVRSKEHFNEKKCTGSFRETGRYVISAGTGQYEGVTGSGEYRAVGRFENACEGQTPTGTFTITARGSINFPSQ
jgi:hypothetical protein